MNRKRNGAPGRAVSFKQDDIKELTKFFLRSVHQHWQKPNGEMKELKLVLEAILAMKKRYSLGIKAAEATYYRIEAVKALRGLYRKYKGPRNVPPGQFIEFLNSRLGIALEGSNRLSLFEGGVYSKAEIERFIAILRRDKESLQRASAAMSRGEYDLAVDRDENILKLGLEEVAAINIQESTKKDISNPLNKVRIGRANLYRIRKSNYAKKIDEYLYASTNAEVVAFVEHSIFK